MRPTLYFQNQRIDADTFFGRWQRSAAALRAAGVREGDVVAMMVRNSPLALELTLAARWIGAYWCPVNWHFKAEELDYILADSQATVFIADAAILASLNDLNGLSSLSRLVGEEGNPDGTGSADATNTPALKIFAAHHTALPESATTGFPQWEAARDAQSGDNVLQGAQRGAMFYTSGTTGRPKGIRRNASTPEQVAAGLGVMRHCMGFDPEKYGEMRALVSAPMYHSAPNSFSLGAALFNVDLHIEERFDAEDTLRLIAEHRITHAYLVPTMYVRMLRLPDAVKNRYDLSSMRFVGSTGSPCSPEVKRAMVEWWGPVIYESYGSSELGYMTRLDSPGALRKPGSAGKALPGVVLEILDNEGQTLPAGQSGLIYAHNPAVADFTYTGNDAARRKMELQGLKTMGDVGYLDDEGFLFIVDRSADMVISGGVNIYPAEIEAVLQMMPGVADCAVFGIPSEEFGEALGCAVQRATGAQDQALGQALDATAVQAYLKAKLASYKVPQVVAFHDALPREDTGKIFKRKLREPYWAGKTRRI